MAPRVDPVQRLKDQIIQLPEPAQEKLYTWLTAVRDVNVENARRQAKAPATTLKEEKKS